MLPIKEEAEMRTKIPRDWKCQECGRLMTIYQAEKASRDGCPRCNSSDIDLAVEDTVDHFAQNAAEAI